MQKHFIWTRLAPNLDVAASATIRGAHTDTAPSCARARKPMQSTRPQLGGAAGAQVGHLCCLRGPNPYVEEVLKVPIVLTAADAAIRQAELPAALPTPPFTQPEQTCMQKQHRNCGWGS